MSREKRTDITVLIRGRPQSYYILFSRVMMIVFSVENYFRLKRGHGTASVNVYNGRWVCAGGGLRSENYMRIAIIIYLLQYNNIRNKSDTTCSNRYHRIVAVVSSIGGRRRRRGNSFLRFFRFNKSNCGATI